MEGVRRRPGKRRPALSAQGFNEGKGKPLTAEDVRFTVGKDGSLYAIILGLPQKAITIKSLGTEAAGQKIKGAKLLGSSEMVQWKQTSEALMLEPPKEKFKSDIAVVYKLAFARE